MNELVAGLRPRDESIQFCPIWGAWGVNSVCLPKLLDSGGDIGTSSGFRITDDVNRDLGGALGSAGPHGRLQSSRQGLNQIMTFSCDSLDSWQGITLTEYIDNSCTYVYGLRCARGREAQKKT